MGQMHVELCLSLKNMQSRTNTAPIDVLVHRCGTRGSRLRRHGPWVQPSTTCLPEMTSCKEQAEACPQLTTAQHRCRKWQLPQHCGVSNCAFSTRTCMQKGASACTNQVRSSDGHAIGPYLWDRKTVQHKASDWLFSLSNLCKCVVPYACIISRRLAASSLWSEHQQIQAVVVRANVRVARIMGDKREGSTSALRLPLDVAGRTVQWGSKSSLISQAKNSA